MLLARFAVLDLHQLPGSWTNRRFPNELLAEMAEAGLFGINYPAEYGGGAHDAVTACKVIEELGKVSAGVALTLFVHWMVVDIILKFGTDAQKRKYLPAFSAARR